MLKFKAPVTIVSCPSKQKSQASRVIWWGKNISKELLSNLYAMNLYPLGLKEKTNGFHPHPSYAQNQNPIVLVHGIIHNHSAFHQFKKRLQTLGWKNVHAINYTTGYGSIPRMAGEISEKIERILNSTGAEQVDIVAHSLGGLVCRHYMTQGDGRGKVRKLITLGTPHNGTKLSKILRFVPGSSLADDLYPESYFLQNLNKSPIPRGAEIVSISSRFDWTLFREKDLNASGTPNHAIHNITYEEIGHTRLLYSKKVFAEILNVLTRKDPLS